MASSAHLIVLAVARLAAGERRREADLHDLLRRRRARHDSGSQAERAPIAMLVFMSVTSRSSVGPDHPRRSTPTVAGDADQAKRAARTVRGTSSGSVSPNRLERRAKAGIAMIRSNARFHGKI